MGRKIFITYKYADPGVYNLPGQYDTRARHYVDALQAVLDAEDHINKGEEDGEDLSHFTDETIASNLRGKIFDSSTTIILISKNMKNLLENERDQWIPWEISYSLQRRKRGDRTSDTNAMLAVVLPDELGSYEYFVKPICTNGCVNWLSDSTFEIIGKNMFNRKAPNTFSCLYHTDGGRVHTGNDHSYIHPVRWDTFISAVNWHLDHVADIYTNIDDYEIVKVI